MVDDLVFNVRDSLEPGSSSPVRMDSASVQDFNNTNQPHQVESTPKRIVILGKTGYGKSSLSNTILGERLFNDNHSSSCVMSPCQAETRSVHGRKITLVDTPGLFDTERSEEALKPEIVRCIIECSPGPHAFLIVLKVERFTEQEEAVVTKICEYFSEEALKYAVIVFTHGDQLHEGMTIEEFVRENKRLSELVQKCGGRCHVIDNKYWKNNEEDEYRNNRVQVEKLLHTIDKMVMENNGGYYTNEMLQEIERKIQEEEEHIRQMCVDLPPEQIREQAKARVQKFLIRLAGVGTGIIVGALLGVPAMIGIMITAVRNRIKRGTGATAAAAARGTAAGGTAAGGTAAKDAAVGTAVGAVVGTAVGAAVGTAVTAEAAAVGVATAVGAVGAGEAAAAVGLSAAAAAGAGIGVGVFLAVGVAAGTVIGYKASKEAETPGQAAKNAATEVCNKVKSIFVSSSSNNNAGGQQVDNMSQPDDDDDRSPLLGDD